MKSFSYLECYFIFKKHVRHLPGFGFRIFYLGIAYYSPDARALFRYWIGRMKQKGGRYVPD